MSKSTTVRTGTAALVLVGAIGFGPGLAASNAAPRSQPATATKTLTPQGEAWTYTGTWMRSTVTTTLQGARGSVPHSRTMDLKVQDVTSTAAASGVSAASCDIVNLVLGPLDLNVLGLEVHLNQVVLDIVGSTGAGNLLGNLLCAVAGLLDGGAVLGQIAGLLNQILAILNGLGA